MRPTIEGAVRAALVEAAPARLVKKLDAEPTAAEAWTWAQDGDRVTVVTDKGETVTLNGPHVSAPEQVACSCLLSPRCLHVLSVVTRLPLAEGASPEAPAAEVPVSASVSLTEEQRAAAARLFAVACATLAAGADAVGAVLQADLLRAVHACRASGLHRGAAAGIRVVRRVDALHERRPDFRLADLAADLHDLVATAAALGAPEVEGHWIGVARRTYAPIEGLRLHGLFCEPIVGNSAGVVTWLVAADGRLFRLGDVRPGRATRAAAAYDLGVDFGGVTTAHRALCRAGLFVQQATASPDGRLGGGKEARAASAGASSWREGPAAALWAVPLGAQLDRAFAALELPDEERPAGADLLFVEGVTDGDGLRFEGGSVRWVAPSDHEALCYVENLRRLAAPGLRLRAVLRLVPEQARTGELLAFAPVDDALRLPPAWGDRVNAGLDTLQTTHLRAAGDSPAPDDAGTLPDPADALRRRLHRIALGGRAALPPEAAAEIARDAARLERRLMPRGATLLRALAVAAARADRTFTGIRKHSDPVEFARVWALASDWARDTTRAIRRAAWRD